MIKTTEEIKSAINLFQERANKALIRSGRVAKDLQILAVTKFHDETAIRAAYSSGVRLFGENRIQEAESKYTEALFAELYDCQLDLVGSLQSNKINRALRLFDAIHSVDSSELLESICKRTTATTKTKRLFLELKTGEDSKSGFQSPDQVFFAIEQFLTTMQTSPNEVETLGPRTLSKLAAPKLVGLMTIAPFTQDISAVRKAFRQTAQLREEIKNRFILPDFNELSMGMSGDFEIAIEEGATLLRIGTAFFGERT